MVDCTGLENRQRATVREFESHRLRQRKQRRHFVDAQEKRAVKARSCFDFHRSDPRRQPKSCAGSSAACDPIPDTGLSEPENGNGLRHFWRNPLIYLAEWTGLEPATPGVTGRYSNRLNYHSASAAALCSCEPSAAKLGDPTGIRTPVPTVKGWCPRPLDDRVKT